MWPYTYSSCGGDGTGLDQPGANQAQRISACPDPPGFDRTKYGLAPGVGRGAPELDIVEMKWVVRGVWGPVGRGGCCCCCCTRRCRAAAPTHRLEAHRLRPPPTAHRLGPAAGCPAPPAACLPPTLCTRPTLHLRRVPPSINEDTGKPIPLGLPRGGGKGQHPNAFNSMTMQAAPLLANGTTWNDPTKGTDEFPQGPLGPGLYLPQDAMGPGQPLGESARWASAAGWPRATPPPDHAHSAACLPHRASRPLCLAQRACGRTPRTGRAILLGACCRSCAPPATPTCWTPSGEGQWWGWWRRACLHHGPSSGSGIWSPAGLSGRRCLLRRPGNLVQDSLSVMATLTPSYFNSFHKFGAPG